MNNVIPFRSRTAAPASVRARAIALTIQELESVRVRAMPRPVLIAIWRSNPVNGRLECRWTCEPGANADEGVSRGARHCLVA
jgi:hypothetical protein